MSAKQQADKTRKFAGTILWPWTPRQARSKKGRRLERKQHRKATRNI